MTKKLLTLPKRLLVSLVFPTQLQTVKACCAINEVLLSSGLAILPLINGGFEIRFKSTSWVLPLSEKRPLKALRNWLNSSLDGANLGPKEGFDNANTFVEQWVNKNNPKAVEIIGNLEQEVKNVYVERMI